MTKLLPLFLILTACATGTNSLVPTASTTAQQSIDFKFDLFGTVNGSPFIGVGVIPHADSYAIKIQSSVDVDAFTVASCHRNDIAESVIKLGWFDSKRGYTYTIYPDEVESSANCPIHLGSYNKDKGQNAWGLIVFEDPNKTLPAKNICDGVTYTSTGVAICQSKAGLTQRVKFTVPVHYQADDPKCKIKEPADGMTWDYDIAQGECTIDFMEVAKPHRIFEITTVGYNQIQIRGAQ